MTITRNTLRADGITVGEAMDRDAAELRRLGFDAPNGALTIDERRDAFREEVRQAVSAAFDNVQSYSYKKSGLQDSDLPEIFPALDKLADKLFNRSLGF